MKSLIRFVVCLLLLVGWSLAALSLHVIRTADDIPITLVTKDRFSLTDTYVDTRTWTLADAAQHPELVEKLLRIHKAEVLKNVSTDPRADLVGQLSDALQRAAHKQGETGKTTRPSTSEQTARGMMRWF